MEEAKRLHREALKQSATDRGRASWASPSSTTGQPSPTWVLPYLSQSPHEHAMGLGGGAGADTLRPSSVPPSRPDTSDSGPHKGDSVDTRLLCGLLGCVSVASGRLLSFYKAGDRIQTSLWHSATIPLPCLVTRLKIILEEILEI